MGRIYSGRCVHWKFPIQKKRLVDAVFALHMRLQRCRRQVDPAGLTLDATPLPVPPVDEAFPTVVVHIRGVGRPDLSRHTNHCFCFGWVGLQAYSIKQANQNVE